MKLKYLVTGTIKYDSGVYKKIISQLKALKRIGIETELIMLSRNKPSEWTNPIKVRYKKTITSPYNNKFEKIRSQKDIARAISEEIEVSDSQTVLYIRGMIPSPSLIRVLRKKRKCKVIFELQSITENEAKMRGSWGTVIAMKFFAGKIIKNSDGIVGVTNEVTLCVAHVAKWHGLDRLIKGITNYNGETEIKFHIIGEGTEIKKLKSLVSILKLEKYVIFHGFKTGKELDSFFDRCHIAIGSLAIHRAGSGSPLKSREYCARGIPFVDSVNDPDFSPDFPYRLKIDSNESLVDLEKIQNFAKNVLKDKEHPKKMRGYAQEKLDWSVKMRKLKDFLENI